MDSERQTWESRCQGLLSAAVGIKGSFGSALLSAPLPSSVRQSHSEHTCLFCSHALLPPNERGLFLEQT